MTVPIIRPVFDQAELDALTACLESGMVSQGTRVADFERLFAAYLGKGDAVALSSCTAALHVALLALGVGPGDEVIVPALTWVATANAVACTGARPVFADVQPETFALDPDAARRVLSPRTRGIIPVHLFGLCADMDALAGLAGEHGLFVLEDAACALGSLYKGRRAGLLGDASCFSFHPRKVITTGEGGMICSERADILRMARSLRSHGCRPLAAEAPAWAMPEVPHLGYNYRMTDLQGALGCAQMAKLEDILAERARIADVYAGLLRGTSVMPPLTPADCRHSWQSYVVRFADMASRNAAADRLTRAGVQCRPGTHAVHRLGWHRARIAAQSDICPAASLCEDTSLALPVVHGMDFATQQAIVSELLNA